MKKIIAMLLAYYVLVLVFAPCVDDDFSLDTNPGQVVSSATLPVHQDQHDCCTPFCTCSCCTVPIEVMKTIVISQDFSSEGTLTFFFDSRFRTRCDFSIWEPPKA